MVNSSAFYQNNFFVILLVLQVSYECNEIRIGGKEANRIIVFNKAKCVNGNFYIKITLWN